MGDRTTKEWLEADGLGGFASGTASGLRTRRYHALLLAATTPPTGRVVLINGLDAKIETDAGSTPLSTQRYAPDVIEPDGDAAIEEFTTEPWPRWRYRLAGGGTVEHEILVRKGSPLVALSWRLLDEARPANATLTVRLFHSGRDFHALQRENASFGFDPTVVEGGLRWTAYDGVPAVVVLSNGAFRAEPVWYLNFLYREERERGLDHLEDLASPGVYRFNLSAGRAVLLLTTEEAYARGLPTLDSVALFDRVRDEEAVRRAAFPTPRARAADAYLVRRGQGLSLIAGYPWFSDWGRDTFIALRGLCLALGRLDEARRILLEWSGQVSKGMLPNRFPDVGDRPEYNSVDASLWFVIACGEFAQAWEEARGPLEDGELARLRSAIIAIVNGYASGTRYGIRKDHDGLLMAGQPGAQLTWMDAKVGDWVVTPRSGKPVEIQALWLNALRVACDLVLASLDQARSGNGEAGRSRELLDQWREWYADGMQSFQRRYWYDEGGYLFDIVDVDHKPGTEDATFRPNQILAVGGLPVTLLDSDRARRVVEEVEARLWTPLGLRTLPHGEPRYRGRYLGDVRERDSAYHQGTAWAWLLGAFVDAWVRVWGGTEESKREARRRFLGPLERHLEEAGLGHVSEIADADPPHTPRGCPFQAWSLGELLRIEAMLAPKRTTESTILGATSGHER